MKWHSNALAILTLLLTLEGTVEKLDEKSVVLRNNRTLIKVPRETVMTKALRPGQWVAATVTASTPVETSALKKLK